MGSQVRKASLKIARNGQEPGVRGDSLKNKKLKTPIAKITHNNGMPVELGRNAMKRQFKGTKIKKSAHLDLSHAQRKQLGAYA